VDIKFGGTHEVVSEDGEVRTKQSDDTEGIWAERPQELLDFNPYELFQEYDSKYKMRPKMVVPLITPHVYLDLSKGLDDPYVKKYCEQRLRVYKRGWRSEEDLTGPPPDDDPDWTPDWVALYLQWMADSDAPMDQEREWGRACDAAIQAWESELYGWDNEQEGGASGSELEDEQEEEDGDDDFLVHRVNPKFSAESEEQAAPTHPPCAASREQLAASYVSLLDKGAGKWLATQRAESGDAPELPRPRLSRADLEGLEDEQLLAVQIVGERYRARVRHAADPTSGPTPGAPHFPGKRLPERTEQSSLGVRRESTAPDGGRLGSLSRAARGCLGCGAGDSATLLDRQRICRQREVPHDPRHAERPRGRRPRVHPPHRGTARRASPRRRSHRHRRVQRGWPHAALSSEPASPRQGIRIVVRQEEEEFGAASQVRPEPRVEMYGCSPPWTPSLDTVWVRADWRAELNRACGAWRERTGTRGS